ncbi:MAG: NAD(+)/NADH kinase [Sarcina sp.]
MNKIGIFINKSKDIDDKFEKQLIYKIKKYLKTNDITVMGHLDNVEKNIMENLDILMVLGGDGTLLGTAREYASILKCPILGINIGNLGFISSVEFNDIDEALKSISNNEYKIEKRLMIKVAINDNEFLGNKAVNDVVIARGTLSRMTEYGVFINNELYTTFNGDGIIVSTAVGSTAYSLSAGGPLISPDLELIAIVPICSHNLNSRPLIVSANSEILIKPLIEEEIYLTIDGQKSIKLKKNDKIKIKKSDTTFNVISFEKNKYFEVLRKKIFCRLDKVKGL